jgi:hypothetical protein
MAPRVGKMSHIVEKPKPDKAASTLAVVGRYLLSASMFDDLAKIGKGAGGEIQLTDGIARLMQREPVYAFEFEGKRYDCGSKLGYLQATVEYGLKHPSLGPSSRLSTCLVPAVRPSFLLSDFRPPLRSCAGRRCPAVAACMAPWSRCPPGCRLVPDCDCRAAISRGAIARRAIAMWPAVD